MTNVQTHIETFGFRGQWVLDPSSTLTPDGMTVMAAPGGGNYLRSGPVPEFNSEPNILINTTTGSDDNDGTTQPLKTIEEWLLRVGSTQPITNQTVTIVGDDSNSYSLDVLVTGTLTIQGTKTIVGSYTLSSVQAWDGPNHLIGTYLLTGGGGSHPDLNGASLSDGRAFARNSATPTIYGAIGASASAGQFTATFVNEGSATSTEPPAGATDIYTVNALGGFITTSSSSAEGFIVFRDLSIGKVDGFNNAATQLQAFGCIIGFHQNYRITNEFDYFGCALFGFFKVFGESTLVSCLAQGTGLAVYGEGLLTIQGDVLQYGTGTAQGLVIGNTTFGAGICHATQNARIALNNNTIAANAPALQLAFGFLFLSAYVWINNTATAAVGIGINAGQQMLALDRQHSPVVVTACTTDWNVDNVTFQQSKIVNIAGPDANNPNSFPPINTPSGAAFNLLNEQATQSVQTLGEYRKTTVDGAASTALPETQPWFFGIMNCSKGVTGGLGTVVIGRGTIVRDIFLRNWGTAISSSDTNYVKFIIRTYNISSNGPQNTLTITTQTKTLGTGQVGAISAFATVAFSDWLPSGTFPLMLLAGYVMTIEIQKIGTGQITGLMSFVVQ